MSQVDAGVNSREWWEDYFRRHWDSYDGGGQTRHFMERLLDSLPGPVLAYLGQPGRSILDWGCAQGQGAALLQRTFPDSRVSGLDCSEVALETAGRHFPALEWLYHPQGDIPRSFDVICCSNTLEHFAHPLEVLRRLLASTAGLCIVLVPYNEHPLSPFHPAQFREESFPERVGTAVRVHARVIEVSPRFWQGKQLLVVYAQPWAASVLAGRRDVAPEDGAPEERGRQDVWSAEDRGARALVEDVVERVGTLVRPGQSIAEVSAGTLAVAGRLVWAGHGPLTLIRRRLEHLEEGRSRLGQEGLRCSLEDPLVAGEPAYDLVLACGLGEHYSFSRRVELLRGLASRSRGLVLLVMPNRASPWYWLPRLREDKGDGLENAVCDLTATFEAAGVRLLGHAYLGAAWTLERIRRAAGIEEACRVQLLELYSSPVLGPPARGSHVAALGAVRGWSGTLPEGWGSPPVGEGPAVAELSAAVIDGLARARRAEARAVALEQGIQEARSQQAQVLRCLHALRRSATQVAGGEQAATADALLALAQEQTDPELREAVARVAQALQGAWEGERRYAQLLESRAWKLTRRLSSLRQVLAPSGSLRARLARRLMGLARYWRPRPFTTSS